MKCGLLGRKLGHSYSPQIHSRLGNYPYMLFEREPEALADFLRNEDFTGINVTAPYKKAVISYLDELSPIADRLGAVNTVVRRDGRLIGHNADYFGFLTMVRASGLEISGKKVLVLGSGGASNTAVAILEELGAYVIVISRSGQNNYENLGLHGDTEIIVNTTPVGMYPNNYASPVDLKHFPKLIGVLDMIYNPARTALLCQAESMGLPAINGLLMLVAQAKEASEWFTGCTLDDSAIPMIHRELQNQMENIVLIGMPGSGKTTLAKMISDRLGKKFVDADEYFSRIHGCSPADMICAQGEASFRQKETEILSQLGKESGLVIATGGGCVTRQENYPLLHNNSKIIWIRRDIDRLPTDGRPLSQTADLDKMYRIRKPMYESFSDYRIDNNGDLSETVEEIIRILEDS